MSTNNGQTRTQTKGISVKDNQALVAIYSISLIVLAAGIIIVIAATAIGSQARSALYGSDTEILAAAGWLTIGGNIAMLGGVGFFIAMAAHAINWQIAYRGRKE